MSTSIAIPTPAPVSQPVLRASFLGIIRGEFLKIRQLFWWLLGLLTVLFVAAFLLGSSAPDAKADLQQTPLHFLYYSMESNLVVFRILVGILLMILTSFTIGREYQYGTIRILLSRGVGRVHLLLAKLVVLAVLALALLVLFTLLTALLTGMQMLALVGNLKGLSALIPAFWPNLGIDLLAVSTSMGATILMAAAMNALGRSLTFGLSASLIWFPVDNIGTLVMNTLTRITHNDFWSNVTAYLLGPLLNRLPDYLLPTEAQTGFQAFGVKPQVSVSAAHAVFVIGTYSLLFLVAALLPTWKRDVKE